METITAKVTEKVSHWEKISGKDVHIIIAGKEGSGKTTLVKALCDGISPKNVESSTCSQYQVKFYNINVWDSSGFSREPGNEQRVLGELEKIRSFSQSASNHILLFAIPIDQRRFPKSEYDNGDLRAMKSLTSKFGKEIWENSIIVYTKTNLHYLKKREMNGSEECKKRKYVEQELTKFDKRVRECFLETVLTVSEWPKNCFTVPAGQIYHCISPKSLECEPLGESWVYKIWHNIIECLPSHDRYSAIRYCLGKYVQEAYFYCDSFLSFAQLHDRMYLDIPKETGMEIAEIVPSTSNTSDQHLLAYSYLRLIKFWFDCYPLLKSRKWRCSQENLNKIRIWKGFKNDIKIIITGESSSGKTSLINSLLYGKKEIAEKSQKYAKCTEKPNSITCTFEEIPTDSLSNEKIEDAALMIVCVVLDDNNRSTRSTFNKVLEKLNPVENILPVNLMIVGTFSDGRSSLPERLRNVAITANRILLDANLGSPNSFQVIPAGYHKSLVIEGEPIVPWRMNVWLHALSSASFCFQPAIAVFLNHIIFGGKARQDISSSHKMFFKENCLQILYKMIPK